MSKLTRPLLLAAAGLLAASLSPSPSRAEPPPASHLLVQLLVSGSAVRVERTTVVPYALPAQRGRTQPGPWRQVAIGEGQRVLHEQPLADPAVLRGELADPRDPSRIEARHVTLAGPLRLTVRVPLGTRRVELYRLRAAFRGEPEVPARGYELIGSAELDGEEVQP